MPSAVIKLPDEPIVIVTIALPIERHLSSLHSVCAQIDRIARQVRRPLYTILDLRGQDLSFSDILLGLDEQKDQPPGSMTDPRVRPIVAGDHPLLAIAQKKARQQLAIEIPVFDTLQIALAYVRAELEGQANHPSR